MKNEIHNKVEKKQDIASSDEVTRELRRYSFTGTVPAAKIIPRCEIPNIANCQETKMLAARLFVQDALMYSQDIFRDIESPTEV